MADLNPVGSLPWSTSTELQHVSSQALQHMSSHGSPPVALTTHTADNNEHEHSPEECLLPLPRLPQPWQTTLSEALKVESSWLMPQTAHCAAIQTHLSIDLLKVAVPV